MANEGSITLLICTAVLGMMASGRSGGRYIPPSDIDDKILARADLIPWERRFYGTPLSEEEEKRLKPIGDAYRKETRHYSYYDLDISWRDSNCLISVKKNFEGGRQKTLARWSGYNRDECGLKIHQVANAIKDTLREERFRIGEMLAESEMKLRAKKMNDDDIAGGVIGGAILGVFASGTQTPEVRNPGLWAFIGALIGGTGVLIISELKKKK